MSTEQDKAATLIDSFEREIRYYKDGYGHWSRVAAAREALQKALARNQQAEPSTVKESLTDGELAAAIRSRSNHG